MNGIEITSTLSVRRYKAGYEIRREIWTHANEPTVMHAAYTPAGAYIGSPRDAYRLVVKRGIAPEPRASGQVCSIGFSAREQKWYGWSHRAIFGFGRGDSVEAGHCTAAYLPIGFTAHTLADAKQMAAAFAESVS